MPRRLLVRLLAAGALAALAPAPASPQAVRVLVYEFQVTEPGDSAIADSLAAPLVAALNARARPRFDARLVDQLPIGPQQKDIAREVFGDSADVWHVQGSVHRTRSGHDSISIMVLDATLRPRPDVHPVVLPPLERSRLIGHAVERVSFVLAMSIRISVFEFVGLGTDTTLTRGFARTIPAMLIERLEASPHLVLLEALDTERVRAARSDASIGVGPSTEVAIGRRMAANYIITGSYHLMDGQLRVDVRCVNLATEEIVAAGGAIIQPVGFAELERELAELARDMREAMENDFVAPETGPGRLAIAVYPPRPALPANRALLRAVADAAGRKLAALPGDRFQVVEDPALLEEMLEHRVYPWVATARLRTRWLVSLDMRRPHPDTLEIRAERFDATLPAELPRSASVTTWVERVDDAVDTLLVRLFADDGAVGPLLPAALAAHPYRHPLERFWVYSGIGAVYWTDTEPFLGNEAAGAFDLGAAYRIRPRWNIRGGVRFDLFSDTGARRVYGVHPVVGVGYDWSPMQASAWFGGLHTGFAGVLRDIDSGSPSYGASPALGGFLGYRTNVGRFLGSARFEVLQGLFEIDPQTVSGVDFPGGRPGGIYALLNLEFF